MIGKFLCWSLKFLKSPPNQNLRGKNQKTTKWALQKWVGNTNCGLESIYILHTLKLQVVTHVYSYEIIFPQKGHST